MGTMENTAIKQRYSQLLTYWNRQDANGMASLFADNGNVIGFDGSQMNGKIEIEKEIQQVFNNHKTAAYVWRVDEIRFLNAETALLRAVAGMVPPGKKEINPATNAIQTLVFVKQTDDWKIALFQNTPAQFHGRPELVEKMTKELSALL